MANAAESSPQCDEELFCFIGNFSEFPMKQNAPQGCAPRGDEVYASYTARARKSRMRLFHVSYHLKSAV